MWNHLPSDLLANIFSYLPPPSLARATAVCRHWHACTRQTRHHTPWFMAIPTRTSTGCSCFVHNPIESTWHSLDLKHVPGLTRPITSISGQGLILFKGSGGAPVQLSVCNPFTGQLKQLPILKKPRTNPAVGVIETPPDHSHSPSHFTVYVAGGMCEAANGGATSYEPTLEMFDSTTNNWTVIGSMPVEFAVRLTVWTLNESVYSAGVLYWMTSARAYSIMGIDMTTNNWKELSVPMGDTLEFAALVPRDGKLAVVGGVRGGDVCVWELGERDEWNVVERMPAGLSKRFVGGNTKCVGIEGGVYLYKDMASGIVVWRRYEDDKKCRWEWQMIEGCDQILGRHLGNYTIKGLFLHPNLASSLFF